MIVKNLLAVGVIATVATAASAADAGSANWKIKGKIRVDAAQSTTESKAGDADKTTSKYSEILLQSAFFELAAEQGATSLWIKYLANTDTNSLDAAVIGHKVNDMIGLKFGRLYALSQSVENTYDVSDLYVTSMAYSSIVANAPGAEVDANFGDHNLSLQILQGVTPTGSSTKSHGGLTTSLQYRGEINKMIRPILTYSMVRYSSNKFETGTGTATTSSNYGNGYQTQLGAGVQVAVANAAIDLEYDAVTMIKQKEVETAKNENINSIVAQVKYAIGDITPFLKITSDSHKKGQDANVGDKTGMNLALGVEYLVAPTTRLHALYFSKATSEKIVGEKTNKSTEAGFNLGVAAWL